MQRLNVNSEVSLSMKKAILILVAGLLLSGNAYAGYTGLGNNTCGNILSNENNPTAKNALIFYMNGYFTARNYENAADVSTDGDTLFYSLVRYCKNNPYKSLSKAAESIYSDVSSQ